MNQMHLNVKIKVLTLKQFIILILILTQKLKNVILILQTSDLTEHNLKEIIFEWMTILSKG